MVAQNINISSRREAERENKMLQCLEVANDALEPIAVIGFSLRYPQDADSPTTFWSMLESKRCAMTDWPKDRINLDAFYHRDEDREGRVFVPGAHFIKEDLGLFDAPFFGISATEANAMDPQHRILLEVAYHALESAGIPMESVYGSKTGVYSGSMADDYKHLVTKDVDDLPKYAATGVSVNMIANRLSWFFNLKGPSVNLDSACSSSLMALDFAVQGLRNGDSDMALVAGGSMILAVEAVLTLMKMNFLSPDGRCYSFDNRANGYARGEGFGVVVIKRLRDAIRDGNIIRGIIRATGSNQDGHTPGVTQPSKDSQARLIKETYEKAGLDLEPTRYFEAHGTGTALGDPIEADAIGAAFRKSRAPEDPLYIGALKSNIGHLEGGSGVAGLIKTLLVLEKGRIPPNANFECLNHRIDADFSNLKFPVKATPWPTNGLRRASVNSFGFGGSNAHAVLDDAYHFLHSRGLIAEHCTIERPTPGRRVDNGGCTDSTNGEPRHLKRAIMEQYHLDDQANGFINGHAYFCEFGADPDNHLPKILVWSASDESGTSRLVDTWQDYLSKDLLDNSGRYADRLAKVAWTLACRRSSLTWKSFAIVNSMSDLLRIKDLISPPVRSGGRSVGLIFTGQGAVYNGMGRALLVYPVFRDALEAFDRELLRLGCQWSVFDEMTREESSSLIYDPAYSQPLTTALQIALVELLLSFNIVPSCVVGHSSGEIAAAYTASALSLESACRVSYHRGRLASGLKKSGEQFGAMMSVDLSENEMKRYLRENSMQGHIACNNSPSNVTVAGGQGAIKELKVKLNENDVATQILQTGVAYHSPQMAEIAEEYATCLQDLQKREVSSPRITFFSSVTGEAIQNTDLLCSAQYWINNLVQLVQYATAVSRMASQGTGTRKLGATKKYRIHDFIEVGPHSALQRPTRSILESISSGDDIKYNSVLSRKRPALETLLELCGSLWSSGSPVEISKANRLEKKILLKGKALVDLPGYTFNHSKRYWHESNMSRHSRLRRHPRHELLGTPVPDWNHLEPRWRKFFDVLETPWIEDHKVNGTPIYPATGMVVMAIEGAKQLADPSKVITGFKLKDATFSHPIAVAGPDRIEVQLFMRLIRSENNKESYHYAFKVCIRKEDEWKENCSGKLQVEYQRPPNELDNIDRFRERSAFYRQKYNEALAACTLSVETGTMYQQFQSNGLNYGPAFQKLTDLAWDGACGSIGTLHTFQWTPRESHHTRQDHVVHPTTLDAAGQLMWVALTKGAKETIVNGAAVTRIQSAWISSSGLSNPNTTVLRAFSASSLKGLRGTDSSMFALDHEGDVKLIIDHMETTAVSGTEVNPGQLDPRRICFGMRWKPDVDLMSPAQVVRYCKTRAPMVIEPTRFYEELRLVLYHYAIIALDSIQDMDTNCLAPHMQKYIAWLQMHTSRLEVKEISDSQVMFMTRGRDGSDMAPIESMADRTKATNPEGDFLVTMGRSLPSIIRGRVDSLEIMFRDKLVDNHYQDVCDKTSSCNQLHYFLGLFAHKNPTMRILEIGAGTGSITSHILKSLQPADQAEGSHPRCSQYDYTDVSETFFENAQERFRSTKANINYKILNIENDPADQGFVAGSYDLVVAAWVLHATRDLAATVSNARRLLKPGGKLVLLEITKPDILRNGFAFGTLPGWWLGTERYREWSPCITYEQWHQLLSTQGFSGVDFILHDYQTDECQENSIMVATAIEEPHLVSKQKNLRIIMDAESSYQTAVANGICNLWQHVGVSGHELLSINDLAHVSWSKDDVVVFLPELERPFLYSLTEAELRGLQTMFRDVQYMLWVTMVDSASPKSPPLHMVKGLARAVCTENANMSFVTLTLETCEHVDPCAEKIAQVLATTNSCPSDARELEYAEYNGVLMINRITEVRHLNEQVHAKNNPTRSNSQIQQGPPLALTICNPGFLDSLQFVEDSRYYTDLEPDEIEIEVKSVGVNFRDLLVILGKYNADTVGCECAGIVTRVGSNCRTASAGDRVCAAIIGCTYTYARCNYNLAVRLPDSLSFAEAASLPITGVTAYHSLITVANLKRNDSILIHSGAGGTGQMAIQVALSIGCEIFVTVSSKEKQQLLINVYNIPEDHILYSRDSSFAQDLRRLTSGRGVDVVLNSLSGDRLIESWECIAPFGRFIELGKADVESNSKLPMTSFAKNVSFSAVAVDYICANRPDLLRKSLVAVLQWIEDGRLTTASPLHRYTITDIETAFRSMQGGKNTGKTVLTLEPYDRVPMLLNYRPPYTFEHNATYVIAGGLGGLGRSTARWMARRGARNLVLLSRSGPSTDASINVLEELKALGVRVESPRCDVSSVPSLLSALAQCASMPPIRGCIQATMVLKDSIFDNMSFADWSTSISSKVHSSWNLHHLLPSDLDFFILLSSVAGIAGSPAQANYAAGNTYQDALAQHRRALGLKATSIDLGWMGDVGIVAENEKYSRGKESAADLAAITEKEFLALLEVYCDPKLEHRQDDVEAQPIIGLITPAQFRARGMELPTWIERPLFKTLPQTDTMGELQGSSTDGDAGQESDYVTRLTRAGSDDDAAAVVIASLVQRLSRALSMAVEEIDTSRPLHVYGVDSLLAVELRNWFAKVWKADISVFDITGQGSITALGGAAAKRSSLRKRTDGATGE